MALHVGVHPDLAGFQDLAHGFDLKSSLVAALMHDVSSAGKLVE